MIGVGLARAGHDAVRYEDVRAFIEYNGGDKDLGFHVELGGEPWTTTTLTDPDGNVGFDVTSSGTLTQQGLATAFLESGEYGFDELSRSDFLARSPEGSYTFVGRTVDGRELTDSWEFTHLIPDPPVITTPAGVDVEVYQLQLFPVDPPKGHSRSSSTSTTRSKSPPR